MPTPRSESIRLYRSTGPEPLRPHGTDSEARKIETYAYLARLVDAGIDRLTADEETVHDIRNASSETALLAVLTNSLNEAILTDTAKAGLEDLRADAPHSLELILNAGVSTYVEASASVFNRLAAGYGASAAAHPHNAAIIDRLAKLEIDRFVAFQSYYLDTADRPEFLGLLQRDGDDGGFRFKPGYPLAAPVPQFSTLIQGVKMTFPEGVAGLDMIPLSEIEPNEALVGCPATFNGANMPRLWELYAGARMAMVRRHIGGVAIS